MDIEINTLQIPEGVYRAIKRCLICHSVYLTDTYCESCGRMLGYERIGEPFSEKSLWGIKSRYYDLFTIWIFLFPKLENKKGPQALSFQRQLMKRLEVLLTIFDVDSVRFQNENFQHFYFEIFEIISILVEYQQPNEKIVATVNRSSSLSLYPQYKNEIFNFLDNEEQKEKKRLENKKKITFDIGVIKSRVLGIFFVSLFWVTLIGSLFLIILAQKSVNDFSFFFLN